VGLHANGYLHRIPKKYNTWRIPATLRLGYIIKFSNLDFKYFQLTEACVTSVTWDGLTTTKRLFFVLLLSAFAVIFIDNVMHDLDIK
jgi:hypothetical protein